MRGVGTGSLPCHLVVGVPPPLHSGGAEAPLHSHYGWSKYIVAAMGTVTLYIVTISAVTLGIVAMGIITELTVNVHRAGVRGRVSDSAQEEGSKGGVVYQGKQKGGVYKEDGNGAHYGNRGGCRCVGPFLTELHPASVTHTGHLQRNR